MSLMVSVVWNDPASGQRQSFVDWDRGRYMAGCESARQDLWGSAPVRELGATFLPQLDGKDLYVANEQLVSFVAEIKLLFANVTKLRFELGRGPDCSLPHYLNNFLRAARCAAERGGGVSIA